MFSSFSLLYFALLKNAKVVGPIYPIINPIIDKIMQIAHVLR
jgi:hypothetical protein